MIVSAANVITPSRLLSPGWVEIDGAFVHNVGAGQPPAGQSDVIDLGDATIVPGFVDGHVHGGGGASFDGGARETAETAARTHLENGTTSIVASLGSAFAKTEDAQKPAAVAAIAVSRIGLKRMAPASSSTSSSGWPGRRA